MFVRDYSMGAGHTPTLASSLPDALEAATDSREKREPRWSGQSISLHHTNDPER